MTISTSIASKTYDGDNSTVSFPTEFAFFIASDIEVIERVVVTGVETAKALTTDYTVTGGNGATGTVIAVVPPPDTVTWTIRRVVAETQGTALPVAGALPSSAVEQMVDRSVMMVQQHSDELGRALVFPKTDGDALNPTIPSSVDRASKLLAFDASGNPIVRNLVDGGTGTMSDLTDDTTPQLGGALDSNSHAINESEGTAVASVAGTTDIWAADGNTLHVTGTETITSLGTAPRVGARRRVIADGAFTLTHSANLNCPGAANIVAAFGDSFDVYADTTTQHDIQNFTRASGEALVETPTLELISSAPASSSSFLEFTLFDNSIYGSYLFSIEGLVPSTDGSALSMRTSTDGGLSYDSGAAHYGFNRNEIIAGVGHAVNADASGSEILLNGDTGNASGEAYSGNLWVHNPGDGVNTFVTFVAASLRADSSFRSLTGSGQRLSAADVDAVTFFMSAGNIASGAIRMYGLRKS